MKAGAETPATGHIFVMRHAEIQRSMKAGAETPATEDLPQPCGPMRMTKRSMKAGAETPATAVAHRLNPDAALRSMKAGAETPATVLGAARWSRILDIALNEGRGRNPGDSPVGWSSVLGSWCAAQ